MAITVAKSMNGRTRRFAECNEPPHDVISGGRKGNP
ncbi:transcription termination factor Rho [Mycobacterium decipiens]|uniref:Transcription termination factor Rho n=1 Tax=Mycobacterium decipiens TaxID=1430326 RepID=A0A1X2LWY8_9MYCO|nr:transcription termination factor Rho [Mycobacterium decipiens]